MVFFTNFYMYFRKEGVNVIRTGIIDLFCKNTAVPSRAKQGEIAPKSQNFAKNHNFLGNDKEVRSTSA